MVKLFLLLFISISVFVIGIYKINKTTLSLKVLSLILLGLELYKFFYNASLYDAGITPLDKLSFSILSLLVVIALVGAFNKGKVGSLCKQVCLLLALVPITLAIYRYFNYDKGLDDFEIIIGLEFVQYGLFMIISYLCLEKTSIISLVASLNFVLIFFLATFIANLYWNTNYVFSFDVLTNISQIITSFLLIFFINYLISKVLKEKQNVL